MAIANVGSTTASMAGGEERDGKMMGPDVEPQFGEFGIDGDIAGYDGDFIEAIGTTELLELGRGEVVFGKRRKAALRMSEAAEERLRAVLKSAQSRGR